VAKLSGRGEGGWSAIVKQGSMRLTCLILSVVSLRDLVPEDDIESAVEQEKNRNQHVSRVVY